MMRDPDESLRESARPARRDDVDEASEQSFPASDAPSWGPLHVGTPGEHPDQRRAAESERAGAGE